MVEFLVISKIVKNIGIKYFFYLILFVVSIQLVQTFFTFIISKKSFYSITSSSIFFSLKIMTVIF